MDVVPPDGASAAAEQRRVRYPGGSQGRVQGALRRGQGQVTEPDLKAEIAGELYPILERLDADAELLAIVGS